MYCGVLLSGTPNESLVGVCTAFLTKAVMEKGNSNTYMYMYMFTAYEIMLKDAM